MGQKLRMSAIMLRPFIQNNTPSAVKSKTENATFSAAKTLLNWLGRCSAQALANEAAILGEAVVKSLTFLLCHLDLRLVANALHRVGAQ
jgi:hypothetical protein